MHQNRSSGKFKKLLGNLSSHPLPASPATITTYNCISVIINFYSYLFPITPLFSPPWVRGYSFVYKNLLMLLFGVFTNSSGCILNLLTDIKSGSLSFTSFLVWSRIGSKLFLRNIIPLHHFIIRKNKSDQLIVF